MAPVAEDSPQRGRSGLATVSLEDALQRESKRSEGASSFESSTRQYLLMRCI